jgi:4-oxalocrotonate tautomerase
MHPGRTEQQKTQLAERIVKDVIDVIKCDEKVVSVAIEEVQPEDWPQKVYKPEILQNRDKLYKQPGYNPFE